MNPAAGRQKKVLMITYAFAPVGYVGTFRTLKYCKYLDDYGWTAAVLTIDPKDVEHQDETLLRQVPEHVRIHRTYDIDPVKWLEKRARRRQTTTAGQMPGRQPDASTARSPSIWKRIKQLLLAFLTNSPDSHLFWVPFAVFKGARILLQENIDVIYCTSPPHSSHIAAFLLAKLFRKPYVLDFRDPWITDKAQQSPRFYYKVFAKLERFVKRRIMKSAASVISATRGQRDELRQEFPELPEERFAFITNGYDPPDFGNLHAAVDQPADRLILTHSGTVYGDIADEFLAAVQGALQRYPGIETKIQINLLGEIATEYAESVCRLEATGIVRVHGLQPHAKALKTLLESDVLLILRGGDHFPAAHVPAKLFEYLYVGKPIFAVAKEGELTQMLRDSGLGIVVAPEAHDELVQMLWYLHCEHVGGRLTRTANESYIRSFERRVLTEKFAAILDRV